MNLPRQVSLIFKDRRLVWIWEASPHGGYAGLHNFWSRVKKRRRWRADRRTMHMESKGPEQLLASNPGLCLKRKRLKVVWGTCVGGRSSFRWILLRRTHEMMVLERNASLPAVQKSCPGGALFVTSMSTPGRSNSLGTIRTRSRCCFRLLALMRVDTKWYPMDYSYKKKVPEKRHLNITKNSTEAVQQM